MKVKVPVLLLSTALGIVIFTIISFFIVWCMFPAEKPEDSFKDALDFSGVIFSGATTFGTAIVAGLLFNDWKENQNYQNKLNSYKNFCSLTDSFIELFEAYIEALWGVRTNSHNVVEHVEAHKKLSNVMYRLLSELYTSQIYFRYIDFEEVKLQINRIDNTIANIPPLSLETMQGQIDMVYVKENGDFYSLHWAFQNLIYKSIRPKIENQLNNLVN